MRPCKHDGPDAAPGCRRCELWATCPDYYCQMEGLPRPEPPPEIAASRKAMRFTLWHDPEAVRRIAVANGRPAPVPAEKPVPPPPARPSLAQMAANLARDAAAHAADRFRKVPLEVYNTRLALCQGCDLYVDNRCTHRRCGCKMAGKGQFTAALWWASKRCPLEPPRWDRYVRAKTT